MSTYIFIDGGYLRSRHTEVTGKWFDQKTEIDFSSVVSKLLIVSGKAAFQPLSDFTSSADEDEVKSFYYDCLDEEKRSEETDLQFKDRIEKQNALIDNVRFVNGCHIRLGALKGSKKLRRQKEVDILLAVDMLSHAARGNMRKAVVDSTCECNCDLGS